MPPQIPKQSCSQSFKESLSHTPHISSTASPPHAPAQSSILPAQSHAPSGMPPPSQMPHSSTIAVPPKQDPSTHWPSQSSSDVVQSAKQSLLGSVSQTPH